MQSNQRMVEVVGKPGKAWGQVMVPTSGTVTMKVTGDIIETTIKSGFEKATSWTRIQNIDSVEISEAPNYLLLAIGVPLALMGLAGLVGGGEALVTAFFFLPIGAGCIYFAMTRKRRLLVIHSLRYTIPVFMTKSPESYQQFAATVMTLARHLNSPTPATQPTRPAASNTNGRVHHQAQPTRTTIQNGTSLD